MPHTIGLPNKEKIVHVLTFIREGMSRQFSSDHEASRHVSIMRSAEVVLPSYCDPLGERSFTSLVESTPSTRIHYSQTDVVRPADLPIGNRKKQFIANTTPSPHHCPVPCTDGNERDPAIVVDQASLQKELV